MIISFLSKDINLFGIKILQKEDVSPSTVGYWRVQMFRIILDTLQRAEPGSQNQCVFPIECFGGQRKFFFSFFFEKCLGVCSEASW